MSLKTTVAFFVFNRPEATARVFEAIRRARVTRLLVVADGARAGRRDDVDNTAAVRKIVAQVDWPCVVEHNFSEENLGCRKRLASGLDWVFGKVEEAIILEDDCLPHPTFFDFCEEMLVRYRDEERVMHIGGANFQDGLSRSPHGYYFSKYPHVWGWASWRRAWRNYDVDMKLWPQWRDSPAIEKICTDRDERAQRVDALQAVYEGRIDTWDFQWLFACWVRGGVSIIPSVNLVSNIGFGANATHTRAVKNAMAERATFEWRTGSHPQVIEINQDADRYYYYTYERPGFVRRAMRIAASILRRSGKL